MEEDACEAHGLSHLGDVDVDFVGVSGLWPRILRNLSGEILIVNGLLPVPPSSVVGRLYSDGSQTRITVNPNAEFSMNGDRVLLGVDNALSPSMVAPLSHPPLV